MYPNKIKSKMKNNELLLGTSYFSNEPHVASAILNTKPDWIWIDQEHTPWGIESIGILCVQARQSNIAPIIRVPWNTPGYIKKAFDVGSVGVMVPQIDSAEEVGKALEYSKYPPIGNRGIAPWFGGILGVPAQTIIENANSESILLTQLESVTAYEQLEEMLKLQDVEVIFVGPTDLSASLGIPGEIHHPKVEKIMLDVAEKVRKAGKQPGTTFGDVESCRRWISEGYTMMSIPNALSVGTIGLQKILNQLREEFSN